MPRRIIRRSTAGILLGIGLGGFIDGILLHLIVHWHNMGSAILPPVTMQAINQNMRWDGLFHAGTWLVTVVGVYRLLAEGRSDDDLPTAHAFTGLLILGWGLFNLAEGLIDHELLGLHHVRDLPVFVPLYDSLFLAVGGIGFILLGWMMSREKPKGWARSRGLRA